MQCVLRRFRLLLECAPKSCSQEVRDHFSLVVKARSTSDFANMCLAQVDKERASARDEFRKDRDNSDHQQAWRSKVVEAKSAQADLKIKREAFYRCPDRLKPFASGSFS